VHKTGLLHLLTGSGRPRTSRSCVVQRGAVADWWYSWPVASTLASLCLSQKRSFLTYVLTINLFSLYLMNFMLHTMLDATGVVLSVHYKSMKRDVLFSQGSVSTIFRWGGHFSYVSKKIYSSLQQCKNYKNRSTFSKVMVTNVLPPFLWFTVYLKQTKFCIISFILFCVIGTFKRNFGKSVTYSLLRQSQNVFVFSGPEKNFIWVSAPSFDEGK